MKPNILLILLDQMRFDCLPHIGKTPIKAPNIERLMAEGTWFDNAFTPIPVCCPAKQSLLTGRQADSFGAFWNYNFACVCSTKSEDNNFIKSLAEVGYSNKCFGAWDASGNGSPTDFGFEKFVPMSEYHNYIGKKYPTPEYKNGWFGEENPIPLCDAPDRYFANRICDEAEKEEKPWFYWVDLPYPHLPCRPSKPFSEMYKPEDTIPWDSFGDKFENKPYIQKKQTENWGIDGFEWKDFAPTAAMYYGMISQLDESLGVILSRLEEKQILDDTMVIFMSDHGDTCGGHGMLDKHYMLYDDVTRVPFIVRFPKVFPKGEVCHSFVSSCLDIAPTVERLCDLQPAGVRHGYSLTDILDGKINRGFAVSTSNGQQFGLFTNRCIRVENFKYVWNLTDIDEFYDLRDDPGEKVNRIDCSEYEEIRTELKEKLFNELCRIGDPFANGWLKKQLIK